MKRLFTSIAALLIAPFTAAQERPELHPVSDIIAQDGLAAGEAWLTLNAMFGDDPETDFLLGGVRFLRGIEVMMQTRWDNSASPIAFVPGMRGDLPPNPKSESDPTFLATALERGLSQMSRAETALSRAVDKDFAATLRITDIWFDVNRDGMCQDAEQVDEIFEGLRPRQPRRTIRRDENGRSMRDENGAIIWDEPEPLPEFTGIVRFDSADADWLAAYVHLLSGFSELVLATDPTPAIDRVMTSRNALGKYGQTFLESTGFANDEWIEMASATLLTLRGEPDPARTRAAHKHFKSMIAYNRNFWREVREETDNDHEWLPNPDQQSAFGIVVTEEIADGWQDVLAQMSAVLEGEALVPYWRLPNQGNLENGVGINLARWLQDPGDMDLILWIQGEAVLPYLDRGPIVDTNVMNRFSRLTRGNGMMFAAWFN